MSEGERKLTLQEALKAIIEADKEVIENMEGGISKKQVLFVREKWKEITG